jgi:pseudouridine-5'-phosphate glycosidase
VIEVRPAVAAALAAGRPVVALETTLVTHGFPQPDGVALGIELIEQVRGVGAVPATIGVLDGRIQVGLEAPDLERLAATPGVPKLNPGNLAAVAASGGSGSTTVAATLLVCRQAGIAVFATGGMGGVHRDANETGDISADLAALARFPVALVCSGAKAILDLRRTREALESLGVPVLGYATASFPAFYTRESELSVDARFDDMDALAQTVRTHLALGTGGVLVGNPIPRQHELAPESYAAALERAGEDAQRAGVRGRDVTPFLLSRLREHSGGATVAANRALLLDNARVGARLAVALSAG